MNLEKLYTFKSIALSGKQKTWQYSRQIASNDKDTGLASLFRRWGHGHFADMDHKIYTESTALSKATPIVKWMEILYNADCTEYLNTLKTIKFKTSAYKSKLDYKKLCYSYFNSEIEALRLRTYTL